MSSRRRPTRFTNHNEVEILAEDRDDFQRLYTENISTGGLFVCTEAPPPLRSRVDVTLKTPDGALSLAAEVVHVLDKATAEGMNHPMGVGLQFVDITQKVRDRIEAYVSGIAAQIEAQTADLTGGADLAEVVAGVKMFSAGISAGDLYASFGVEETATEEEIRAEFQRLGALFASSPAGATPAQKTRFEVVASQLERASRQLLSDDARLRYDFRTDRLFVAERLEQADGSPEKMDQLRHAWTQVFAEELEEAAFVGRAALEAANAGNLEQATLLAEEAVELDPFNRTLRRAAELWRNPPPERPPGSEDLRLETEDFQELALETADIAQAAPSQDDDELLRELRELKARVSDDHFAFLGLPRNATSEQIRHAFCEMAKRLHPDRLESEEGQALANEVSARINEAYQILQGSGIRLEYAEQLSLEPGSEEEAVLKHQMGVMMMRRKRYAEARELLRNATESNPGHPGYKADLAWAMFSDPDLDGKDAIAISILEAALENKKTRSQAATVHYYLGRIRRAQGQQPLAKQHFLKALEANPDHRESEREIRLIELRSRKGDSKAGRASGLLSKLFKG